MMDENGDGKISADESEDSAEKLFEKIDANDDDKLTITEMTTAHEKAMAAGKPSGKMTVTERIKIIDTNKDGVVSEDEFEESAKLRFENLDTNKDGYVTKAELQAGHDKPTKGHGK